MSVLLPAHNKKEATIIITKSCGINCIYCHLKSNLDAHKICTVYQMNLNKYDTINICGGEPTFVGNKVIEDIIFTIFKIKSNISINLYTSSYAMEWLDTTWSDMLNEVTYHLHFRSNNVSIDSFRKFQKAVYFKYQVEGEIRTRYNLKISKALSHDVCVIKNLFDNVEEVSPLQMCCAKLENADLYTIVNLDK